MECMFETSNVGDFVIKLEGQAKKSQTELEDQTCKRSQRENDDG